MFETAVIENTQASVVHGGSQQNGPILGNGCALFLAKFTGKLISQYNQECDSNGINHDTMDAECYKNSLDKVLCDLSVEDMREHGRLLLLKEKLMSYIPQEEKKNLNRLAQF